MYEISRTLEFESALEICTLLDPISSLSCAIISPNKRNHHLGVERRRNLQLRHQHIELLLVVVLTFFIISRRSCRGCRELLALQYYCRLF